MLITSGGHDTVALRLATCFSNPSSLASLDNFYLWPTLKGTPFSQNPALVPFFIQGLGVLSERRRQPCLSQKFQNYLWPWIHGKLADSMAEAGNIQDEPELSCRIRKSHKMHIRAHTHNNGSVLKANERAPNMSNKLNNAVWDYKQNHKLNGHQSCWYNWMNEWGRIYKSVQENSK